MGAIIERIKKEDILVFNDEEKNKLINYIIENKEDIITACSKGYSISSIKKIVMEDLGLSYIANFKDVLYLVLNTIKVYAEQNKVAYIPILEAKKEEPVIKKEPEKEIKVKKERKVADKEDNERKYYYVHYKIGNQEYKEVILNTKKGVRSKIGRLREKRIMVAGYTVDAKVIEMRAATIEELNSFGIK